MSSKSRYALMALVELDLRTRAAAQPVRLADLARSRELPEQFLEQLFAGLRRAGLVSGPRGVGGGFTFARRPAFLNLGLARWLARPSEPGTQADDKARVVGIVSSCALEIFSAPEGSLEVHADVRREFTPDVVTQPQAQFPG